ncbi:MAG: class I SAM-dependent methyltransferase [Rhodobacteraceae bacterium]|nr:class I SAM-dependent methyltransferase [Paracoccaceae bacterium]
MEHLERLAGLVDPRGLDVVDVGAGTGAFAAALAGAGARVTGIEVEAEKVARARAAHGAVARFLQGCGEDLPLPDGSADLVCFMFSLHHVPAADQPAALAEAARVLRPGGRLHVVEPDVTGPMTSVVRLIDDETEVREATAAFLDALSAGPAWRADARFGYTLVRSYRDFDALAQSVVLTDPSRAAGFEARRAAMQAQFDRVAVPGADGYTLAQPCTARHLRRAPAIAG